MSLFDPFPDHSSLSRIHSRYGLEVFRRFFEAIVQQCQQEKLVWGKELYFDGTQVNANADLDSLTPRFAVEAREAIQAHLAALFPDQDKEQEQQVAVVETADSAVPLQSGPSVAAAAPSPTPLPVALSEPERCRSLALRMPNGTTGSPDPGNLNERFAVCTMITNVGLISVSVRPIQMRLLWV